MPAVVIPTFAPAASAASPTLNSPIEPFETMVAAVLAKAHETLTAILSTASASAPWVGAIVALVVVVRTALLPFVARQVLFAHAYTRAQPELAALSAQLADRGGTSDPDALRAHLVEVRAIRDKHGVRRFTWVGMVLQALLLYALYRVLAAVAAGQSVGSMTDTLVESARSTTVAGVGLADTLPGLLGGSASGPAAVLITLVAVTAAVTYATQRWLVLPNLAESATTGPLGSVQRFLPALAAAGLFVGGLALPAGVLLYWAVSAVWTAAQQAVITRWWPTPTSSAASRWQPRSA